MRDISTITGQALPSTAKLLWATFIALAVAAVLLLIAVLPAEYGLDPTGLGKKLGLTALHQPDSKSKHNQQGSPPEQAAANKTEIHDEHSHEHDDNHKHDAQTHDHSHDAQAAKSDTTTQAAQDGQTAPSTDVLQKRTEKWRSDSIKLTLPPKRGLEVKALLDKGERLLFQWVATGGTVNFDMHGNVVGAAEGDYTSHWLDKGKTKAAGTFTAPYTGLHGWYWENETDQPVTLTLDMAGYYRDLVQY